MIIFAIETSCDDTSIAIFRDDKLLNMDTKSQIKIHTKYGGVVPEIAAREHENAIFIVAKNVLKNCNLTLKDIDYIAVTSHPGLIPSLLTGLTFARTLSKIINKPILELDHIQGHIFANYIGREMSTIRYPIVCLTVSGGHNNIYYMKSMWDIELIGQTEDDRAGEAYDKVSKMMGLGYPGGPIISKLAEGYKQGNKKIFPRVFLDKSKYDFSFSGLKSAVKREIDKRIVDKGQLDIDDQKEISFEFQSAINEVLSYKLINAGIQKGVKTIMLSGGVSANDDLKDKIKNYAKKHNFEFIYPTKNIYSMDNGRMIGMLAYYKINY